MSCQVLNLAKQLIKCPSLSPDDAGCQMILISRLQALGFFIERMNFGKTFNFWAYRNGVHNKTLTFAGHTDVVPGGDHKKWSSPPFEPSFRDGILYGRGAVDMKGSLAAMIVAAERFISQYPVHQGRLAFLITSDEEDIAKDGTEKVVNTLINRHERLDFCLLGEPSSEKKVGDIIKNGRRGSITANILIQGVQGHVAYPHLIKNPVHLAMSVLNKLVATEWDNGNEFFPPSTMQIVNIHAGTGFDNVTPGELEVQLNFRFNNELTYKDICSIVHKLMIKHGLSFQIDWKLAGQPFLTDSGELMDAVVKSVRYYQGITPKLENTGGTSDGRFIARMGAQVIELGLINRTIHKVNECVSIFDLQLLSKIYQQIMQRLIS